MDIEMLAMLAALGFLALVVVGVPALIVGQARLRRRVAALEAALAGGGARGAVAAAPDDTVPVEAAAEPMREAEAAPAPAARAAAGPGYVTRLMRWLRGNWAVAVAGVSLALAGVFLVQYGVEQGLLTPAMRVLAALGLGAALVVGGDVLRRRHGDAAAVPSGLAGAGLIVLFAGVLAARALYGLIDPGAALTGLVAVAALAVV